MVDSLHNRHMSHTHKEGRGEGLPVSDDKGGPTLPGLVQSLLHYPLTLCVQGRGGLIQEEDFGVPHESSGNGDALLLPA